MSCPSVLRAAVHTTLMSPDGRYVYIVGSKPGSESTNQIRALDAPATLIKVDAVTLATGEADDDGRASASRHDIS